MVLLSRSRCTRRLSCALSRLGGRAAVALLVVCAVAVPLSGCEAPPPAPPPASFTFTGSGWGHGVGMGQWGAAGLAAAGWDHQRILAHFYAGTSVVSRPSAPLLRVLVADGRRSVTVVGTTAPLSLTAPSGAMVPVPASVPVTVTFTSPTSTVATWAGGSFTTPEVSVDSAGPVRLVETNRRYLHGALRILPRGGALSAVVGPLTMQQYLYGLGEMPSSWPQEALRAQAVAGRSFAEYVVAHLDRASQPFDLDAGVRHQSYIGWEKEAEGSWGAVWRSAVDATDGRVVTYNNQVALTAYSSSTGGRSEASSWVWGGDVPYLRPVDDPGDAWGQNPNHAWSRTVTSARAGQLLGCPTEARSITVSGPSASGRVDRAQVSVRCASSTVSMTGTQLRQRLNAGGVDLRSTRFTVRPT